MPKNTYGVKPRGKKWTACPWIPGQGKHVWAGTFSTEAEATKAAIAKIEELRKLPAHLETVESFAQRWMRDFPRPKESTNDRYSKDAQRFAKEVGPAKKLNEITVPEARSYAQKHRHDLGALRAMFSDARRDGLVLSNPFSELGISKGRGRRDLAPLTEEELHKLADIAADTHEGPFGLVFRSVILFAGYTTMRPGEIFGLDRADLDLKSQEVRVSRQLHKRRIQLPKSGKTRVLPYLPPQAVQAIRDLPSRVPAPKCPITGGEILFPGKMDQRITQSALTGYWKPVRVAFAATVPPERRAELQAASGSLDFYALRHMGATLMIERGVESWVVARMMGHEDGGRLVEQRYGHPRDSVAKERLRRAFQQNVQPLRAVDVEEAAH